MMRRSLRAFALGLVYDSPVIPRPGWSFKSLCTSVSRVLL